MDLHLIGFMHHKEQQVVLLLAACQLLWPLKELHTAAKGLLESSHGEESSVSAQHTRRGARKKTHTACLTCTTGAQATLGRACSRQCRRCAVRFSFCSSKLTLGASHQDLKGVEPLQAAPGPRLIQRLQV